MKVRALNQLLTLAALVGILAACTGMPAPATNSAEATSPLATHHRERNHRGSRSRA
jgi:hypothetical protein